MNRFININAEKNTDISPNQEQFHMHIHECYEIFCFLTGNAKYIVEGTSYPLHRGDFVLMRHAESHRICIQSDAVYRRMILNFIPSNPHEPTTKKLMYPFKNRPLGMFNHYPSACFSNSNWLHYMEKICENDDNNIKSSYLTVLLNEISDCFEKIKQFEYNTEDNITAAAIQYINMHLTEKLSLQKISDYFFISKSQLNRNFKNIIGTTVWEYITQKRLLLAKKQIEEGGNPTKIYTDCGFNDYTTFYRAYYLKFGFQPSKTTNY